MVFTRRATIRARETFHAEIWRIFPISVSKTSESGESTTKEESCLRTFTQRGSKMLNTFHALPICAAHAKSNNQLKPTPSEKLARRERESATRMPNDLRIQNIPGRNRSKTPIQVRHFVVPFPTSTYTLSTMSYQTADPHAQPKHHNTTRKRHVKVTAPETLMEKPTTAKIHPEDQNSTDPFISAVRFFSACLSRPPHPSGGLAQAGSSSLQQLRLFVLAIDLLTSRAAAATVRGLSAFGRSAVARNTRRANRRNRKQRAAHSSTKRLVLGQEH